MLSEYWCRKTYHLISKHQDCLKGELALAIVEEIFQTRAQEINDHDIVVSLNTEPVNIWDADFN